MRTLLGWDELPSSRLDAEERPFSHGRFDTAVWADERIVTLQGQIVSQDRDDLLHELAAVMTWPTMAGSTETLTVTRAGRTLTAQARLTAFKTPTDGTWSVGAVPFVVEWRCRDPYRYGTPVEVETGFARDLSGLRFPLFTDGAGAATGVLTFGDPGDETGMVSVSNPGTADAWPVFRVAGPVPSAGFEIATVENSDLLRFRGGVADGSVLTILPADGLVTLDGQDRLTSLTSRDWAPVPPGATRTYHFRPLGGDSTAVLSVELSPTYW